MQSEALRLLFGLGGTDIVLTVIHIGTGLFFVFTGYHKLFNKGRHEDLVQTLKADRIPFIRFNQWWVPSVEFFGGIAVTLGLLTVPAAIALVTLLAVAMPTDGYKRVRADAPIDALDDIDDWLYVSEVTYIMILTIFILDNLLF
jgi:putative oxidoreductase